jgi:hypothetical protein
MVLSTATRCEFHEGPALLHSQPRLQSRVCSKPLLRPGHVRNRSYTFAGKLRWPVRSGPTVTSAVATTHVAPRGRSAVTCTTSPDRPVTVAVSPPAADAYARGSTRRVRIHLSVRRYHLTYTPMINRKNGGWKKATRVEFTRHTRSDCTHE